MSSDIPDDLVTESLNDQECVTVLLNCIKKLKKQKTYLITSTN